MSTLLQYSATALGANAYWPVVCDGASTTLTVNLAEALRSAPVINKVPVSLASVTFDGGVTGFTSALNSTILTLSFSTPPAAGLHQLAVSVNMAVA